MKMHVIARARLPRGLCHEGLMLLAGDREPQSGLDQPLVQWYVHGTPIVDARKPRPKGHGRILAGRDDACGEDDSLS